jgi:serine phosphatase RsbU (regulator of sigma subunit)
MIDGRLIVVLGDVTGHGIGPALLAAACRAYARAAFGAGSDLLAALTHINTGIARDLDPSRFVTFASAACTPATGELEVLSAGHGPILLYSAAGDTFQEIDSQGVPLGVVPDFVSGPSSKLELRVGDIFLLITDGFVEFENPKQEEFGKKRLEQTIRSARTQSPEQIIKSLYEAVLAFSNGTRQMDDLTAVVIKRV